MNKDVRQVMIVQCRNKGPKYHVFINPRTGRPYTDLKKSFGTACRLARISDLHWHDLRHTFGTRLGEAGYNAFEIMELMGHSDIKTSLRYVHPTTERKRTAVEAVQGVDRLSCPKYAPNEKQQPPPVAVNG